MKEAVTSGSISEAGKKAGYSQPSAAHRAFKTVQEKMPEVLERWGITDDFLVENCILPGLTATKTHRVVHDGIVYATLEDVDHDQRGKYVDRVAKFKGLYPKDSGDGVAVQVAGITINVEFGNPDREAHFAAILSARRGSGGQSVLDATVHEDAGRKEPG